MSTQPIGIIHLKSPDGSEQEAVLLDRPPAETKFTFAETQGGPCQVITVDGKPMWTALRGVEVCGRVQTFGKDSGALLLFLDERARKTCAAIENLVKAQFVAEKSGAPVGPLYMSAKTLDLTFASALSNDSALRVNVTPAELDVFDADRKRLPADVTLDGWTCDVIVQPRWLWVTKARSCVHWRLRQLRVVSHPTRKELARAEPSSDWSL